MGTFNEFAEKLQNDQEFLKKVDAAVTAKKEAGETDAGKILASVAEEFGYSITEEEIKAYVEQNKDKVTELSEEEMGKVSGGFLFIASIVLSLGGLSYAAVTLADQLRDK